MQPQNTPQGLIVKKLLIVLIGVGALLVTAAYWIGPSESGQKAVPYERRAIEHGALVDTVSATGQLAPRDTAVAVGEEALAAETGTTGTP